MHGGKYRKPKQQNFQTNFVPSVPQEGKMISWAAPDPTWLDECFFHGNLKVTLRKGVQKNPLLNIKSGAMSCLQRTIHHIFSLREKQKSISEWGKKRKQSSLEWQTRCARRIGNPRGICFQFISEFWKKSCLKVH